MGNPNLHCILLYDIVFNIFSSFSLMWSETKCCKLIITYAVASASYVDKYFFGVIICLTACHALSLFCIQYIKNATVLTL